MSTIYQLVKIDDVVVGLRSSSNTLLTPRLDNPGESENKLGLNPYINEVLSV